MESNQFNFLVYINSMGLLSIKHNSIEHNTSDFPINIEQEIFKLESSIKEE